jgi:hypothetical protein
MDGVLVGALGAAAAVAALFSWLLLARPEAVAGLLAHPHDGEAVAARHPAIVRLLQVGAAGLTVLLGFLTGLALAFLGGTG